MSGEEVLKFSNLSLALLQLNHSRRLLLNQLLQLVHPVLHVAVELCHFEGSGKNIGRGEKRREGRRMMCVYVVCGVWCACACAGSNVYTTPRELLSNFVQDIPEHLCVCGVHVTTLHMVWGAGEGRGGELRHVTVLL